jgi:drug/metabolite transporter (DMT)-like permease
MGFWRRLASWRQDPSERLAQNSFLDDIAKQWKPATAADRSLERRARLCHLLARLFDGSGTLAPVAISLVPTGVATGLLSLAGQPLSAQYADNPPALAYLLLTLGAIGLACESVVSPRSVRPLRWSISAAPIAVGSVLAAVGVGKQFTADKIMVAGFIAVAAGMLVLTALPVVRDPRLQAGWLHAGMVISGMGLLATVAGDLCWTALFRADGDNVWALGTGLASVGAWLFGTALIRSRPAIAAAACE